ncbi:MAG: bifunctional adenosylcobinamide kinase/adenosylcobinamide-phosphate guanylyltransferase, partial [Acidimicrobiales bacterium]
MGAEITLVLGGARSGKSEVAERLALGLGRPITYVATGGTPPDDPEWAERLARHRARRGDQWETVELELGGDLATMLREIAGPALVDSLGTWVAALDDMGAGGEEHRRLNDSLEVRRAAGFATVVVSEEVGLGVHPSFEAGRLFRDALGTLNRDVAKIADGVLLVVAGRVLPLS